MTSLRSLTRQPTISGYLMDFILYNFKSHEFKQHLEYCMPDGTVNQTRFGDIYWNSSEMNSLTNRPSQHFSFHPGGSQSRQGAVHLIYEFIDVNLELKKITIPINIFSYRQSDALPYNVSLYGDYIIIDKRPIYIIDDELERNVCIYYIDKVGNCLSDYLSPIIYRMGSGKTTHVIKKSNTRRVKKPNTRRVKKPTRRVTNP